MPSGWPGRPWIDSIDSSRPPGAGPVNTVQRRPRRAASSAALSPASPPPTTAISVSFNLDTCLLYHAGPFVDFGTDQGIVFLGRRSHRLHAEARHALIEFGRLHRANDIGVDATEQVARHACRRDDADDAHCRKARDALGDQGYLRVGRRTFRTR